MLIAPHSSKNVKVVLVYFYMALVLISIATMPLEVSSWYSPIIAFLAAIYVGDLISGLVHFTLDYKKSRENIGLEELFNYKGKRSSADYNKKKAIAFAKMNVLERIIFNFKLHHPLPAKLGKQSYAHLCSVTILFGGIPFLLLDAILRPYFESFSVSLFLITLSLLIANSQYVHSLAHKKNNTKFATWLMKKGILISKKKHAIHHATLDRDYCTINGYANSVVNVITRFLVKHNFFSRDGLVPKG